MLSCPVCLTPSSEKMDGQHHIPIAQWILKCSCKGKCENVRCHVGLPFQVFCAFFIHVLMFLEGLMSKKQLNVSCLHGILMQIVFSFQFNQLFGHQWLGGWHWITGKGTSALYSQKELHCSISGHFVSLRRSCTCLFSSHFQWNCQTPQQQVYKCRRSGSNDAFWGRKTVLHHALSQFSSYCSVSWGNISCTIWLEVHSRFAADWNVRSWTWKDGI